MNAKRLFSLALTPVLALSLLAGCGADETDQPQSQQTAQSQKQESTVPQAKFAYQAEYIPLSTEDGGKLNYVNEFAIVGTSFYYVGNVLTGTEPVLDENEQPVTDENGEAMTNDIYEDCLFRMDLDTGSITRLNSLAEPEYPEGMEGNSYIHNILPGVDDTIWLQQSVNTYSFDLPEDFDPATDDRWQYYSYGETYSSLIQLDAQGNVIKTLEADLKNELGDSIYLNEVQVDTKGNFYTTDYENIYLIDTDGNISTITPPDASSMGNLTKLSADEIGYISWNSDGITFVPIDPETKAAGEAIKLTGDAYTLYPGSGEYRYYYENGDSIYGYVEQTDSVEKVFSWLDCDVDNSNLRQISFLEDGRIAAMEQVWSSDSSTSNLIVLHQVDASTLPEKKTLTLGCMGMDYTLRPLIVAFNRAHSDIRIVVEDYTEAIGEDATYYDTLQRINTQILSGNGPDILCLSSLPVERYASKGLLVDLWTLIDSDPEIGRENLMTHLFDAMSIDGKLYQITNSFSIQTASVAASIADGRTTWSLQEMQEALNQLGPDASIFDETDTKDGVLTQCLSFNLDAFLDWSTGTCSFDSQEFIDLLNFANSFVEEFDYSNYDWETAEGVYSRLQSGKQLMTTCYISSFGELQVYPGLHGCDITYIGFPSSNGSGSCFNLGNTLAISSTCSDLDAAWSFVRELLLEENQDSDVLWSNFPSNKHAFEAAAKEAMTPRYYTDPETGEQVEESQGGYGYGNDFEIEIYAATQEQYDMLLELYERVNSIYSYDNTIMELIQKDAAPFFAGQKTAEEAARLIQSSVSLYVAEEM